MSTAEGVAVPPNLPDSDAWKSRSECTLGELLPLSPLLLPRRPPNMTDGVAWTLRNRAIEEPYGRAFRLLFESDRGCDTTT